MNRYAEGGVVEQQLDKMEQLVMRGAVSVCMPAQYLLRPILSSLSSLSLSSLLSSLLLSLLA
jgi:hypothetical protein